MRGTGSYRWGFRSSGRAGAFVLASEQRADEVHSPGPAAASAAAVLLAEPLVEPGLDVRAAGSEIEHVQTPGFNGRSRYPTHGVRRAHFVSLALGELD
jgi:hypothetical protein